MLTADRVIGKQSKINGTKLNFNYGNKVQMNPIFHDEGVNKV